MRSPSRDERGAVTAELVTAIPAVLITLSLCLGSVAAAGVQLRLTDAAAIAARSLGRGDARGDAEALVEQLVADARLTVIERGELLCANVRRQVTIATFTMPVSAETCALGRGR